MNEGTTVSVSNVDDKLKKYKLRLISIAEQKRGLTSDETEIGMEMKSNGVTSIEARAVKLAVKYAMEEPEKRVIRVSIEEIAASLGDFADLPLGRAALQAAE